MKEASIGVRLKGPEKDLLVRVAEARGETVSTFVRRAILRELARMSLLDEETKKVLEVA
jgi:uncharacterized protein (DUF1778 family)